MTLTAIKKISLAAALLPLVLCNKDAFAASDSYKGILLYHSYSSYEAMDSRLILGNSPDSFTEISSDGFIHAMNGDFGSVPCDIIFMAIDPAADEWDIFRYNSFSGKLVNLTENSGFRNEDPKFSPDGNSIIFKRGYWSNESDCFIYDLAELDLRTKETTMLTNDISEDSMPCYSADGDTVYYARLSGDISEIYAYSKSTGETTEVYSQEGVYAYYPMTCGDNLCFTRWHSSENHTDCIAQLTQSGAEILPFCSPYFNCSDVFPISDNAFIYSSTQNGSYDLFLYDNGSAQELQGVNSPQNELGASLFTEEEMSLSLYNTADFLNAQSCADINMDADGDGCVTSFDLTILRKMYNFYI